MNRYSTFAMAMLLVVGGLMLSAGTARAQAFVVQDAFCLVADGNCNLVAVTGTFVTSDSLNGTVSCHAQLPSGAALPPQDSVKCNFATTGLPCGTSVGPTDDYQQTVTSSGQVNLTCHVNGQM